MSDEAFARRFYSDRAELLRSAYRSTRSATSSPARSSTRSARSSYFLPPLELSDDELAALQTCLYLLEGQFAYAEPLRLALQNLALGRPGFARAGHRDRGAGRGPRSRLLARDAGPAGEARVRDLEAAHGAASTTGRSRATSRPSGASTRTRCCHDNGIWYLVGHDLDATAIRTFRVSRIRGDIKLRDAPRARFPAAGRFRGRRRTGRGRRGRSASSSARPASRSRGDTAWWVERAFGDRGRSRTASSSPTYSSCRSSRRWILRQDGRARAARAGGARRPRSHERSARVARARTRATPPATAEASRVRQRPTRSTARQARSRPSVSASCRRSSPTCSTAAATRRARRSRRASSSSASASREEALEEHLSLLNLVNFGGGCYAVYAELDGDTVHVEKELFGDAFRAAAAPDAARGAGDPARARVRRADDRRRRAHPARPRPAQARGDVRRSSSSRRRRSRQSAGTRSRSSATLSDGDRERRLVELEYLKEGEEHAVDARSSSRTRSSARCRTGTSTRGIARATASAASGSTGCATRELSTRRSSRARASSRAAPRRPPRPLLWYSPDDRALEGRARRPAAAPTGRRWRSRRSARRSGSSARSCSDRGEAVVLEPEDLRVAAAGRGSRGAPSLAARRGRRRAGERPRVLASTRRRRPRARAARRLAAGFRRDARVARSRRPSLRGTNRRS